MPTCEGEEKEGGRRKDGRGKMDWEGRVAERRGGLPSAAWIRQWMRGEKGERQGEELGLGRPVTSFFAVSTAHSFALQDCRAHLKNLKCAKSLGDWA